MTSSPGVGSVGVDQLVAYKGKIVGLECNLCDRMDWISKRLEVIIVPSATIDRHWELKVVWLRSKTCIEFV